MRRDARKINALQRKSFRRTPFLAFSFKLSLLWERDTAQKNEEPREMSDNVIQFRKPKPEKTPRPPRPWLRKLLSIAAVIIIFAAAWVYFRVTG